MSKQLIILLHTIHSKTNDKYYTMNEEEIIEELNKMKDEINKLCEVVKEYLEEEK